MALVTRSEIKGLLGITDSSRDDFIEKNLPGVTMQLFSTTNHFYELSPDQLEIISADIKFQNGTPSKIIDPSNGFLEVGFAESLDYVVRGSALNNGVYPAESVSAGEIVLASGVILKNEDLGRKVRINIIQLTQNAKQFIADLLDLKYCKKTGIKSERFDDWQITYNDSGKTPDMTMDLIRSDIKANWRGTPEYLNLSHAFGDAE